MAEAITDKKRSFLGKPVRSWLFLSLAVYFSIPHILLGQTSSPCVDANNQMAVDLRHLVGVIVSLPDTVSANERTRFGLPLLAENQVTIVSDTAVCRTASLAYDAAASVTPIDKPVVVLALGNQRLVIKNYSLGEWLLGILFNQIFTVEIKKIGL